MKRTIVVSDLNGSEIAESDSATVTVSWPNRDKQRVLEITSAEADELFGDAGREVAKRGRKKAAENGGAEVAAAPAAEAPAEAPAAKASGKAK